jgi:hypothetical protein
VGVVETRAGGVATGLVATGTATRTVALPLLVSFATFALLEGATIAQGDRGVVESRAGAAGFLVVSLIVDRGVVESRATGLFSRPPPCFRTGPALVFVSLAARGTRVSVVEVLG